MLWWSLFTHQIPPAHNSSNEIRIRRGYTFSWEQQFLIAILYIKIPVKKSSLLVNAFHAYEGCRWNKIIYNFDDKPKKSGYQKSSAQTFIIRNCLLKESEIPYGNLQFMLHYLKIWKKINHSAIALMPLGMFTVALYWSKPWRQIFRQCSWVIQWWIWVEQGNTHVWQGMTKRLWFFILSIVNSQGFFCSRTHTLVSLGLLINI